MTTDASRNAPDGASDGASDASVDATAEIAARIRANLAAVQGRIAEAAAAAGRDASEITLVAVTKYAQMPWVRALLAEGIVDLGENRPQQLAERQPVLGEAIRWHLIGTLQRNKVGLVLDTIPNGLIHSVDSVRLGRRIRKLAADRPRPDPMRPTRVLLQVNVTGEASKQGLEPGDVAAAIDELASESLQIDGLMTMAAVRTAADDDGPRRAFDTLRRLRDDCASAAVPLPILSMGMSGDFEDAIAAGATHLRVGSTLFDGCQ